MSGKGLTTGEGPLTTPLTRGRSPGPLLQPSCPTQEVLPRQQRGGFGCTVAGMPGMCLFLAPLCWAGSAWPQPLLFPPWGQVLGRRGGTEQDTQLLVRGRPQGLACRLGDHHQRFL